MKGKALLREVLSHPVHWLAFGVPAGLAPKAPGTVGSLWAIPLYLLTQDIGLAWQLLLSLGLLLSGIWICGESARRLGVHDHSGIIWDEILGCYLTLLVVAPGWLWIWVGFGLFRFFDIVKPRPIRDLDHRLGGGLGIMLDDVVAALYAALSLAGLQWIFLSFIVTG